MIFDGWNQWQMPCVWMVSAMKVVGTPIFVIDRNIMSERFLLKGCYYWALKTIGAEIPRKRLHVIVGNNFHSRL